MFRSIGSVVLGFALWTVLWLGLGAVLKGAMPGEFNDAGLAIGAKVLAISLAASVVISLGAGVVAAVVAARKPITHALVLSVLLLLTGIFVQASVWHDMPLWYHLSFLILLVPAVLIGAAVPRRGAARASVARA